MNSQLQYVLFKRLLMPLLLLACLLFSVHTRGQERPPRPILVKVSTLQHLQFGSFIQNGSLGEVIVSPMGGRIATGSVILPNINSNISAALFVVDAEPGTLISILNGPDVLLTGSKGGTMKLKIGESSTRSPFITRTQFTDVTIGGTLTVGSLEANPAGEYSGTFTVTFIQE